MGTLDWFEQISRVFNTLVDYLSGKLRNSLIVFYPEIIPSNEFPTALMKVMEHRKKIIIINQLFLYTLKMDEEVVAAQIVKTHREVIKHKQVV